MAKTITRPVLKATVTKQEVPVVRYCVAKVICSLLSKAEEKLKKDIVPVANETKPMSAGDWTLSYTKQTGIERLDMTAIRADMGEEWLKKYTRNDGVRETLKPLSLFGFDARIKKLELTDELCDDLMKVMLKHAKKQSNA